MTEAKRGLLLIVKLFSLAILVNLVLTSSGFGADGDKLWDSDGVAVTQASQDQERVRLTTDGAGGAIVIWQDKRDGDRDIYVQRLDSDGNPLWILDGVKIAEGANPDIENDGVGGAIIAWHSSAGIFAQRINSDGVVQWAIGGVLVGNSIYNYPIIGSDGAGGAFIVFFEWSTPSPRIVHIDSSGVLTPPGVDGVNLGGGVLTFGDPVICGDGSGGAVVAWANGIENIVAQRVASDLSLPWGTTPIVVSNDPHRESRPEVAGDGSGGTIITWVRQPEPGYPNTQVVVQRIDGGGNPLWTPGGVILVDSDIVGGSSYAWGAYEVVPVVASDKIGGAIIAWNDWRNEPASGGNDDIFAQRVDANGTPRWTAGGLSLHPYPGSSQRRPRIVSDQSGGAIVTFQDMGLWSWDIYAVGLDGNGRVWTSYVFYDGSPSEPGENQTDPRIVFDGTGPDPTGAIIAWVDDREDSAYWGTDIYAQKVEESVSVTFLEVGPPGSGYPYTTIRAAIDDAIDGAVVLVHDGTYVENINFSGKAITVRSENGAGFAIIDGNADGSVISFTQGEGVGSVLDGFTLRNGSESSGGGIRCYNSSPTITNCIVVENTATYLQGGGIYCYNSSPTITNCIIARNRTENTGALCGGGGIGCYNNSSPVLTNCTIYGNTTVAQGGAIICTFSSATVVNSILWGNSADGSLDQIYLYSGSSIDIRHSNVQQESGAYPGVGNINANPVFENPAGDNFHLLPGSPCIDTGSNSAFGLPPRDFEGDLRILDGDNDGTPTVDMGVDEFTKKPDLIVESIVINPVCPKPYEPYAVYVTIRNRGTKNIPGVLPYLPFQCAFNSGSKPFSFWQPWDVFGLDAGESTTKQFDFPGGRAADSYTLGAIADYGNKVAESDENNNYSTVPLIVDLRAFETILETANASKWFGGDDRVGSKPRNIGVGQSFNPQGDCHVNSVGFRFSGRFDYYQNPTGQGHEVTLVLNTLSDDGTIMDTAEKRVSAGFNGGWINFDLTANLEAGKKYIFACYLKDGEIIEYSTGVRGHTEDLFPDSRGYSGQISVYGGDMEDWSNWSLHPWGFNFRISGIYSNICEGDFDEDGDVDGSDLALFAADFGRTDCDSGPECEGDFDNDGDVDGSDLAVFAADFGRTDCPH